MIAFLSLFFHMTSVTTCYQRLSGNTNHNNVDHKYPHLPAGHYPHNHRWNEPYFDLTMPRNITSLVGKSAYLGCRVKHLGNKTVAWIRHRDLHILTVGTYTYATDQRFQTSYHRDIDEWTLQIKWAQQRDAGVYECQISTQPVRSFSVILNIVDTLDNGQNNLLQHFYNDDAFIIAHDCIFQSANDEFQGIFGPLQSVAVPTATILGGPDLYVDRGSTINLTCVIKFSPEPPTHIFWYHQDKVLSEENSGGRLKFKTLKSEETKSILLINDADLSDSGKYSCYPSNTQIASVRVHVLQGERPEAMQTNGSDGVKLQNSHNSIIIITIVAIQILLHILAIFIQSMDNITVNASFKCKTTVVCNNRRRNYNDKRNSNCSKCYNVNNNNNNKNNGNNNNNCKMKYCNNEMKQQCCSIEPVKATETMTMSVTDYIDYRTTIATVTLQLRNSEQELLRKSSGNCFVIFFKRLWLTLLYNIQYNNTFGVVRLIAIPCNTNENGRLKRECVAIYTFIRR